MNTPQSDDTTKVVRLRTKKRKRELRPLTAAEKRDYLALKAKWEAEKKIRNLSLPEMSSHWELHRSAPAPYLRGEVPLTTEWKMRFAVYLDCKPEEIWPGWEYRALTDSDIPPSLYPLSVLWKALSRAMRADVLGYIQEKYGKTLGRAIDIQSMLK
jgi:hypothetical protein